MLINILKKCFISLFIAAYRLTIQKKVKTIRQKDKINVLFVLTNLPKWKTESLFKKMLINDRFNPIIGLTLTCKDRPTPSVDHFQTIKGYLTEKGYEYVELLNSETTKKEINPDIIIYQEPYQGAINDQLYFWKNRYALFCYAHYGFYSTVFSFCYNEPLHNICWQVYCENEISKECSTKLESVKGKNFIITGLPMTDILMEPREQFKNPWKNTDLSMKKIIWAPHCSIFNEGTVQYSIFLDIAEYMLEIAQRYSDKVHFAFKPHPDLKRNLEMVWGREKTNKYYEKWYSIKNAQVETGEYVGLFKYSDAMIHDCASFTIEYLYMNKPVLYCVNGKPHKETLNEFGSKAFEAHYLANSKEQIDEFINNVIHGEDPMYEKRQTYYDSYLKPPYENTASCNIINAILGKNEYTNTL